MTPLCRPCFRGDHEWCVGLGCQCESSERCRDNAELTREREADVDV